MSEFQNDIQCRGLESSLDLGNICAVHTCPKTEFFLRDSNPLPQFRDLFSEKSFWAC